jgi:hypothetical protein
MQNEIRRFLKELWNQLKKTLTDKCGDFPLGDSKPEDHSVEVISVRLLLTTRKYTSRAYSPERRAWTEL